MLREMRQSGKKSSRLQPNARRAPTPDSKPLATAQDMWTLLAGRRNLTSFTIKTVGIEGETLDEVVNLAYDYAADWRKDKLYTKENIKAIFEIANDKFEDIVKI